MDEEEVMLKKRGILSGFQQSHLADGGETMDSQRLRLLPGQEGLSRELTRLGLQSYVENR